MVPPNFGRQFSNRQTVAVFRSVTAEDGVRRKEDRIRAKYNGLYAYALAAMTKKILKRLVRGW